MKLKNIGAFQVSIEKYAGKSSRVSFFLYFLYVINVICWAEQMKMSGVAHVTRNDNIARVSKGGSETPWQLEKLRLVGDSNYKNLSLDLFNLLYCRNILNIDPFWLKMLSPDICYARSGV